MKLNLTRSLTAISLAVLINACSSNDIDPDLLPAERPEIENKVATEVNWQAEVGDGVASYYTRLKPAAGYQMIFAADREGLIKAFEEKTGKLVWQQDIREGETDIWHWLGFKSLPPARVGGLVASYQKLYVGTENGDLVALNVETGEPVWRSRVAGEILSAPVVESGKVISALSSGQVVALDAEDGEEVWQSSADVPALTLRGASSPAFVQGGVFVGTGSGKVVTLNSENGQMAWDVQVAKPQGATDLARIADVDASPIVNGYNLYAFSAGGALTMLDLRNAREVWKREYRGYQNMSLAGNQLLFSDERSIIYALDSRTGVELWSNNQLRNRHVTAGAIWQDYYAVGDFEGYLYLFDIATGQLLYSNKISDEALLAQPIVVDEQLVIQTRDGEVLVLVQATQGRTATESAENTEQ
ncbi:outer membrane protein assembly factor BamB [Gayadomonas joobiniege]|uniref:outer membrane protein assembly factor BamB n=1 Tax=Gayadomonas joobiniege TaxID=1234606 RepID=UPI000372CA79|nr:outer membrane protein assembly factor BamB [Gayadomonas joobiniege]